MNARLRTLERRIGGGKHQLVIVIKNGGRFSLMCPPFENRDIDFDSVDAVLAHFGLSHVETVHVLVTPWVLRQPGQKVWQVGKKVDGGVSPTRRSKRLGQGGVPADGENAVG